MNSSPLGQRLLPLAAIASAVVLGASEFMTMFELVDAGMEPLESQTAGDRHSYALLVLAVFAVVLLVVHIRTAARPPVLAAATLGALAVLLILILDVPKINEVGSLSEATFTDARAEAQPGFWVALTAALGLAISAAVMATLRSPQQPPPERTRRPRRDAEH